MPKVEHGRGYVYSIQYHFVWCVKYRHPILVDEVDTKCKEILFQIALDNDFTITEIESEADHIHLSVECTPQHSIPSMTKALKGVSARLLFKQFPQSKKRLWGGHLWNPSYFVSTVSDQTEYQIKAYIQSQNAG